MYMWFSPAFGLFAIAISTLDEISF